MALRIWKAQDQGKRTLPFVHLPHSGGAHRRDNLEHLPGRNTVTRKGLPVHLNLQGGLAGNLLHCRLCGAGNRSQEMFHLLPELLKGRKVRTEELDPHIAANPGKHLINPKLDRLRHHDADSGQTVERLLHPRTELRLIGGTPPLGAGLEGDEDIGQFHPHGVGSYLCTPETAPHMADLMGKLLQQQLLHAGVVRYRLRHGYPCKAHHTHH